MTKRQGRVLLIVGLLALVCAGLLIGMGSRYDELDQAIQVMAQVKLRYVEPVSLIDLFRSYLRTGTIDGMLATLNDPYTRFLNPAEYDELRAQTDGTFGGIGVTLNQYDKDIIIMNPIDGSPGQAAGLLRGDKIVKVDGKPTSEMTVDETVAMIRGPAGTKVTLTIQRGEGDSVKTFDVEITRANIKLPSVENEYIDDPVAGKIAFITISQFSERTSSELEQVLNDAEKQQISGIILDLRWNPGGLLDAAIDVSSMFLDNGPVLYMIKRNQPRETYNVRQGQKWHYPMVVLVNQMSASASEIVAGALKDRGAATLVGAKTFGKGVVQEVVPFTGRGTALSVTVAKYLTAGGNSINHVGIEPQVESDIPGLMDHLLKGEDLDKLSQLEQVQRDKAVDTLRAMIVPRTAAAS